MFEGVATSFENEILVVHVNRPFHFKEATKFEDHRSEIILKGNVTVGNDVEFRIITGGSCIIGRDSIIGDSFRLHGRDIILERNFWSGRNCTIGGGSCFEPPSKLRFGYFGHMGDLTYVNTARAVSVGTEVGLGTSTRLYTHGAYLDFSAGFPVEFGPINIGNKVWLPQATVLPGVNIGNDVVVAAGSIVHKDIPSGCLAGGVPAKILKESMYPNRSEMLERVTKTVSDFKESNRFGKIIRVELEKTPLIIRADKAEFNLDSKIISGEATRESEIFRDHLRRYGIRFPFEIGADQSYNKWSGNL